MSLHATCQWQDLIQVSCWYMSAQRSYGNSSLLLFQLLQPAPVSYFWDLFFHESACLVSKFDGHSRFLTHLACLSRGSETIIRLIILVWLCNTCTCNKAYELHVRTLQGFYCFNLLIQNHSFNLTVQYVQVGCNVEVKVINFRTSTSISLQTLISF